MRRSGRVTGSRSRCRPTCRATWPCSASRRRARSWRVRRGRGGLFRALAGGARRPRGADRRDRRAASRDRRGDRHPGRRSWSRGLEPRRSRCCSARPCDGLRVAVTFDYWQTLVSERRGDMRAMQIDRWLATLAEAGQPRTADELVGGVRRELGRSSRNGGGRTPASGGRSTASGFVSDHLGLETAPTGCRAALIDNFRIVGETADAAARPRASRACLASAARRRRACSGSSATSGSPSSRTLRRVWRASGCLDYFDAWSFSDETGWFKPAAEALSPGARGARRPRRRRRRTSATTSAPTSRAPRRSGWSRCSTPVWPSSAGGSRSSYHRAGWPTTSWTTWPPCPASSASRHLTGRPRRALFRVWLHQRS